VMTSWDSSRYLIHRHLVGNPAQRHASALRRQDLSAEARRAKADAVSYAFQGRVLTTGQISAFAQPLLYRI
jgi:adenosine deaminase